MLNFDSDAHGHGHGDGTCKRTSRKFCMFTLVRFLLKCAIYKTHYTRLLGCQNTISPVADLVIVFGNPGNMKCYRIAFYRVPTRTGKPGKWKGIFQSGKSHGILNKLEKSGKIFEKLLFQANFIYFF